MKIECVWEHNGNDSILYSCNIIGAFTRGRTKEEAIGKMPHEIASFTKWIDMLYHWSTEVDQKATEQMRR